MFTEEKFLKTAQVEEIPVTIFLIGGIKLQGIITSFDEKVMFLRRDSHTQMIYKSAVSSVMPSQVLPDHDEKTTD